MAGLTVGASQLDKWLQCPRQWAFKALRVEPREQDSLALDFGIAVHRAVELAGKREIPRTVRAMGTAAIAVLRERGRDPDPLFDRLRAAFTGLRELGGFDGAVHFERPVQREIGGGARFFGMIDRIDRRTGTMVLIDYKTGKPKDEHWADASPQASAYIWALCDPTVRFEFWYLEHAEIVSTTRTRLQLDEFEAWLRRTTEAMARLKDLGDPASGAAQTSHLCGWCGWSHLCPAVDSA